MARRLRQRVRFQSWVCVKMLKLSTPSPSSIFFSGFWSKIVGDTGGFQSTRSFHWVCSIYHKLGTNLSAFIIHPSLPLYVTLRLVSVDEELMEEKRLYRSTTTFQKV